MTPCFAVMKVINMGVYLCNADCIMLIRTKIILQSLIPLDEERNIPPGCQIITKTQAITHG